MPYPFTSDCFFRRRRFEGRVMDCPTQNPTDPARNQKSVAEILNDLGVLFARMDMAYQAAAIRYGFRCTGCEDSCCNTLFFHHTHIERHYLCKGLHALDRHLQDEIRRRAAGAWRSVQATLAQKSTVRVVCPLNFQGRCRLYTHRPMICRLHGIPYQLQRPGKSVLCAPGCESFMRRFGKMDVYPFDRTPLYAQMAMLEQRYRAAMDVAPGHKVRLAIAQMLAGDNMHTSDIAPLP